MTYTYKFCANTHLYLFHSEYQFTELRIHSHMNAQTMTVYKISKPSGLNSVLQSFGLWWKEQTVSKSPILLTKLEKVIVKCYKQWEYNIRIYCILNAEINIILLHRNKQDFESSIIQWRCCFLDENFHLFLMITCFTMQICDRVGHWAILVYTLGARLTSTCLRSRHLHEVEKYTRTMVFWAFSPLVPPHFVDWRRHLDLCHISESSDHRI